MKSSPAVRPAAVVHVAACNVSWLHFQVKLLSYSYIPELHVFRHLQGIPEMPYEVVKI